MSGFNNEVMYAVGERLQPSDAQSITIMQDTAHNPGFTNVSNVNHVGNPNNVVSANPASLSHDPVSGFLWLKVSGTGTTVWQRIFGGPTAGFVQTLTGNLGPAIPPDGAGNINIITANTTIPVTGSGNTLKMDFLDPGFVNLGIGSSFPSITAAGQADTAFGAVALNSVTDGAHNTAIGTGSLQNLTTGNYNSMLGDASGQLLTTGSSNSGCGRQALTSLTTASQNSALGAETLVNCTGSSNTALGYRAGHAYTGTESSNLLINNEGILGESNVTRIGTAGAQTSAYLSGVTGVTVAGSAPIGVASTGQFSSLGFGTATQVLTSNGAATSPTWQAVSSVFSWLDNSGAFAASAFTGYFLTAASTPTLPLAPAQGTVIEFAVVAAATMTITANTGQFIVLDGATSLAAGTAVSATVGNTIKFVYRTVGTTWWATSSVGASWTIT